MNTKIIKLDINKRLYEKILAKQGDTKSRFLLFYLLDSAAPFSLVGRSVRVYGLKPDNHEIFNDLKIINSEKGHCELELTSQALAVPGDLDLELVIMEGESKLSTIPFTVYVEKSLNSTNAIESKDEFKALENSLIKTEAWNKEFEDKSGKLEELYTERLNQLDSSLEEKANKSDAIIRNNKRVPTISISSDDGWGQEVSLLAPVLKKYNVPCTCALITSNMTNIPERLELQNKYGWEFASHTVDHLQLATLTPEEMDYQLRESKKQMEEVGYKVSAIVYPVGSTNRVAKRLAKKYYKHGYLYNNKNNSGMMDSFSINRIPLGSYYVGDIPTVSTLEYYKSKIDEAFVNNGWVIFCLHPYHADMTQTQWDYLEEVIKYAQSKNFIFTNYSDGYAIHGNAVESGDSDSANRIVIDNDGNTNLPIAKMTNGSVKASDDISMYPIEKISICQIGNYDNAGFPENKGGILVTHRTNDFAFQYFYPRNNNNEYRRVYTTSWSQFEIMRDIISNTGITNSTSISEFVTDKVTITRIGTYDNAGLPEGKAGILSTYRNGADDLFSYQTFLSSVSGYMYKRHWKSNAWGSWELIITKTSSACFNLDMSTAFQKTPTYIDKYVSIDKIFSSNGIQPTLSKEIWLLTELSTDSANPTILGTAGSNRNLLGYVQEKVLYICYSSVGNNYNTFLKMSFC